MTTYAKNLFDEPEYREIVARIDALTPDSEPNWGQMTVGQMLAHCAEVTEVSNGKELRNTPFYVKMLGGVIRKAVLSPKPFPHSGKTHPQYIMTSPHEFATEKTRLLAALEQMHAQGPTPSRHPLMGDMSAEDRGWAAYKHLDHHLTQFGG